jgi:hypothetical protein
MTPRTPQCEVFWALLLNPKHSGVSEDSKSPTLEVLGFTPTLGQSGVATQTLELTKYIRLLIVLECLLILMHVNMLIILNTFTSFSEELEPQLPIIIFLKKLMPYGMLVFCDEKWNEIT